MSIHAEPIAQSSFRSQQEQPCEVPEISRWLVQWFGWYGRRLLRKHFHSVRISCKGLPPSIEGPLIVYLNHASWWDPIVALYLHQLIFAAQQAYAPIDSKALLRYRFFKKMGFFGVEQGTARGGIQFLRRSLSILQNPRSVLWLTPQGRFADARERPVRFQPGIGHLVTRVTNVQVVPLAMEYVYWEEKLPEVLLAFGKPLPSFLFRNANQAVRSLETQLAQLQDYLGTLARERRSEDFQMLLYGASGVNGIYDLYRRFRARYHGERFTLSHGTL